MWGFSSSFLAAFFLYLMRYLLIVLLSISMVPLWAERIPKETARMVAFHFLQERGAALKNDVSLLCVNERLENRSAEKEPALYIFNHSEGKGFVIVSGDDRVKPVLGYSLVHNFPQGDLPCNVSAWLEEMRMQIESLTADNLIPDDGSGGNDDVGETVVQLETPLWGQDEPYNDLCPTFKGKKSPSGCVMTATAIVMRYYQWPERGAGVVPGYTTATHQHSFPSHTLGHAYDWSNMPYSYESYTEVQAQEISTLMFDLGMMLEADYDPNGTGAYTQDIPGALHTYMGYASDAKEHYRSNYSTEQWNALLQKELDSHHPVIYGGFNQSMSGGHAFVLDGYTTTNYYSVNWGWNGAYNGFFLLSALEPSGQGTGGNGSNFNYNQSAILGLRIGEESSLSSNLMFLAGENGLNGIVSSDTQWEEHKSFSLTAGVITNMSSNLFKGSLMLALTDKQGKIKQELTVENQVELASQNGYTFQNCLCSITVPIEKGDRIRAYYKDEQATGWSIIKGNENSNWELVLSDENTIDETTELIYTKQEQLLKVRTKVGVQVSFMNRNGLELMDRCRIVADGVTIDVKGLPKDTYLLKLAKGHEQRTIEIILKGI